MVDVTSIVISVISLAAALVVAFVTWVLNNWSDERKRLSASEKLVARYRDPLLLAAEDLSSRLWNIIAQSIHTFRHGTAEQKEALFLYTSFLIGQYFSWTHILRIQAQFVCFNTDKDNEELSKRLGAIEEAFSNDGYEAGARPFMLYRGQQMAIGELMTAPNGGELFCIGYAAFREKWEKDVAFRQWFHPIENGITAIADAREAAEQVAKSQHNPPHHAHMIPDHRLRLLHHLLFDLMDKLDHKGIRLKGKNWKRCTPRAPQCACTECDAHHIGREVKKSGQKEQV
jgi:hypothetical protein